MRKEYTSPEVMVTVIVESDVIMASGLTVNQTKQETLGKLEVKF